MVHWPAQPQWYLVLRGQRLSPGRNVCPADRKEGLLIEGVCRPIPWDKVLNVASPDGGAHACWQHFGHPPAVRCVILPGET